MGADLTRLRAQSSEMQELEPQESGVDVSLSLRRPKGHGRLLSTVAHTHTLECLYKHTHKHTHAFVFSSVSRMVHSI